MRVEFDEFGRARLEAAAEHRGVSVAELLGQAARRCLDHGGSHRISRLVPRFRRRASEARVGTGLRERHVVMELPTRDWQALEAEARRQGVALERLLEHAALHLAADMSRG